MKAPFEDLTSMAMFAEVVQRRSFSTAARELGVAKSAVSKRVSILEERLGIRLLTRTTRKLSLTEDGVRYYEHCAQLLAAAHAAEEAVAGASTATRGILRVNAPVSFAHQFLAEALADFLIRHEHIEIELSTDDRIVDVIEGGFDVVVRIQRLADSSLVARRLATDRVVVCGSPAYLERHGRPSTPSELVGHNCLHYSLVSRASEWRFRGKGRVDIDIPTRGNLSSSDGATLRHAAASGLGLAVVPWFMAASDVAAGKLEVLLENARRSELGIYAVYASRRQLPARTRLLLDHLADWFAKPDWRLRSRV